MKTAKWFGISGARTLVALGLGVSGTALATAPATGEIFASKTIDLHASVPLQCTLDNATGDAGTLTMTLPVTNGIPEPTVQTVQMTVKCNLPTYLTLESTEGAVRHISHRNGGTGLEMSNFTHEFDYVALARRPDGGEIDTLDTSTGTMATSPAVAYGLDDATAGEMSIFIDVTPLVPPDGKTLIAGEYSDSLVVRVGASD